jgi:poly-gamma-glutamate capsule biosynthesis protein CapA/YwtB (metallophosphatase superfamily)
MSRESAGKIKTIGYLILVAYLIGLQPLAAAQSQLQSSSGPEIKDQSVFDPNRPLANELRTSIADGFTFVAVGDCIISRPMSQYAEREPGFAATIKILQQADATYGNMETSILDLRGFHGYPYSGPDDVTLIAEPAVAKDLAKMGFDVLSRANNHALDWGVEGMRETNRHLDEAGLVYAGSGENVGLARAPQYFESSKGRVAIVSMASTFPPWAEALPAHGAAPGRPGISALKLKKIIVLPPQAMAQLNSLAGSLYPNDSKSAETKSSALKTNAATRDKLTIFGSDFETGKALGYRYEMDPSNLAEILKSIRQGKEHSDFLIATIHSHDPANSSSADPTTDFADRPADFLRELAHAAIDAGADEFVATGIHHLGPVEIYKGHPIFYGLGDFFWSDIQEPLPANIYDQYHDLLEQAFRSPLKATDADLNNLLNNEAFAGDPPFQSVVTESHFDHGMLSELRLYPLDLGYGNKLTESGIPRLALADKAQAILQRIQKMSDSYGTKIEIVSTSSNGFVGVIRADSVR